MSTDQSVDVPGGAMEAFIQQIFTALGLPSDAAARVAAALVDADRAGLASHGVMMVPLYVRRIREGSVSKKTEAETVQDHGSLVVMDAGHALGQLTAHQAMNLAIARAREHGLALVTVRHGFHFGAAGPYARLAAQQGCIGLALCNTRPLMPATGGAEPLVGNNPVAIALPSDGETPVVVDMALSEAAMGKIRMAASQGQAIPSNWAVDEAGAATTDPAAAIAGMLLPAAGPKGFGLAFMVDALCGMLSGGGWGDQVTPLYGEDGRAYNCSHAFMAVDVQGMRPLGEFKEEVAAAARRVRGSDRAPGVDRIYSPGEREWQRQEDTRRAGDRLPIAQATMNELRQIAKSLNLSADALDAQH